MQVRKKVRQDCIVTPKTQLWVSEICCMKTWPLHGNCLLTQLLSTLSDESRNQGLVCARMHSIVRTQKSLTFISWTGECHQQNHTQSAPSTKTVCGYLYEWIKYCCILKILTKNGKPRRYCWKRRISRRRRRRVANYTKVNQYFYAQPKQKGQVANFYIVHNYPFLLCSHTMPLKTKMSN